MKIITANNDELTIQARNDEDYKKAWIVAEKMVEMPNGDLVLCCHCDYEMWVQLTAFG